jgi:urea transport system permease protein
LSRVTFGFRIGLSLLQAVVELALLTFPSLATHAAASPQDRATLVQAILGQEGDQAELVNKLSSSNDPLVAQTLAAWRVGEVFIHEADGVKTPFLLEKQTDATGKARAVRIVDGEEIRSSAGQALSFAASELTPADTSRALRKVIKQTLDLMSLSNPDPKFRRDSANRLGFEQNPEYLPFFETRLKTESEPMVRKALAEAVAITQLASNDPKLRKAGARQLGELRSISAQTLLRKMQADGKANPSSYDAETLDIVRTALIAIDSHIFWGNVAGTVFRGLSLGSVLLIAALGLAITFGLMGVINMAHGEMIMVGAYAAYVTQNIFKGWFGESGSGFDCYFPAALLVAFASSGLLGLILERCVVRFLYARPLESLLATWGVSLVLQQGFRAYFGAANVFVASPSWLRGTYTANDVLFAHNRIFAITFSALIVITTYLLLTRTRVGLQVRAVMQNRTMAACLGVRTQRMNMITFAFGSGLAGLAGACLAQIGNVGPSLGQSYVVDCFMVVVLGGVGNMIGTISASLGMGVADQILQMNVQAVLAKVWVLAAVILFLQWRPAGLFVARSRSLEG